MQMDFMCCCGPNVQAVVQLQRWARKKIRLNTVASQRRRLREVRVFPSVRSEFVNVFGSKTGN